MLFSSITCTLTRMRSPRGFNVLNFGATAVAALTETRDRRQFTAPATWPGLRLTRPPQALRPWNDAILHCPATAVPSCPTVAMAAMSAMRIREDGLHDNARECGGELLLGFVRGWRWRGEGLGFGNCSCSRMLQKLLVCKGRGFCGYGWMGHEPSHAHTCHGHGHHAHSRRCKVERLVTFPDYPFS